jgi:hypothetical protein
MVGTGGHRAVHHPGAAEGESRPLYYCSIKQEPKNSHPIPFGSRTGAILRRAARSPRRFPLPLYCPKRLANW